MSSTILPPLTANFGGTRGGGASLGTSSTSPQQPPQSQQSPAGGATTTTTFGASSPPTFGSSGGGNLMSNPLLAAARSGPGGSSISPSGGLSMSSREYRRTLSGNDITGNNTGTTTTTTTIGANPLLGMTGPPSVHPTSGPSTAFSAASRTAMGALNNRFSSDENNGGGGDSSSFGIRRRRPVAGDDENENPNLKGNVPPPPPKISLGMISSGRYSGEYGGGVATAARSKISFGADVGRRELPTSKVKKPSDLDKQLTITATTAPNTTTIQSAYTTNKQNEYANWVVIYGFTSSSQHKTILHRFETYGTILQTHYKSDDVSNFLCVKYESFLQAEKALCQHGTFLECDSGDGKGGKRGVVVIGVSRVDRAMAVKLGLSYGGDGSITVTNRSSMSPESIGEREGWRASSPRGKAMGQGGVGVRNGPNSYLLNENDILLFGEREEADYYRRRGNVCDRFMAWLVGARERLDGY